MPAIEIFSSFWQTLMRFTCVALLIVIVVAIIYQFRDGKELIKELWQELKEGWVLYFRRGPKK